MINCTYSNKASFDNLIWTLGNIFKINVLTLHNQSELKTNQNGQHMGTNNNLDNKCYYMLNAVIILSPLPKISHK